MEFCRAFISDQFSLGAGAVPVLSLFNGREGSLW